MSLKFAKMHGLGNDFMVIDGVNQRVNFSSNHVRALAQRNTGIGFDQCLIIEKSPVPNIDFFYRIFNANGQEVGQCGNGARCLARFAEYYGLINKKEIIVATKNTTMKLKLNNNKTVTVEMPEPKLNPADIPLKAAKQEKIYSLNLDDEVFKFHALNVGNPHAVGLVSDINDADVQNIGMQVSTNSIFPLQTNVGFMEIVNPTHIKLRVYERGVGETLACGSGAVAAMAAGYLFHNLATEVTVDLLGGQLAVVWAGKNYPIYLTGPATFVYEGILFS